MNNAFTLSTLNEYTDETTVEKFDSYGALLTFIVKNWADEKGVDPDDGPAMEEELGFDEDFSALKKRLETFLPDGPSNPITVYAYPYEHTIR